jgi:cytochrome c55X
MARAAPRVLSAFAAAALGMAAAAGGASADEAERVQSTALADVSSLPTPGPARARELLRLLKQDCGSCHGMRLTGGLGPPLTPAALGTKPAASLVATIESGRPGTAMPPWRRFVSEAEAQWLVARMVAGDVDASP